MQGQVERGVFVVGAKLLLDAVLVVAECAYPVRHQLPCALILRATNLHRMSTNRLAEADERRPPPMTNEELHLLRSHALGKAQLVLPRDWPNQVRIDVVHRPELDESLEELEQLKEAKSGHSPTGAAITGLRARVLAVDHRNVLLQTPAQWRLYPPRLPQPTKEQRYSHLNCRDKRDGHRVRRCKSHHRSACHYQRDAKWQQRNAGIGLRVPESTGDGQDEKAARSVGGEESTI
mmetsp:Transcript_9433/g.22533  ORF Transcript_9433/g.22533 Transcript_9433/m.22533 type:complete len:234 (+) Transcript_9433:499-1200(+)